jgi:hypothetical protein
MLRNIILFKTIVKMSRKLIELMRVFNDNVSSVSVKTLEHTEEGSTTVEEQLRQVKSENEDLISAYEITQQELDDLREQSSTLEITSERKAIIDLFKKMNSSEYGNLLDNVAQSEKQIKDLKAKGWEPPPEAENCAISVRMFYNFLKKFGIFPIIEIGSAFQINLGQSENYDYEGSEFKDGKEIKNVKVYAPGWTYQKDIISRTKVREIF